MDNEIKLLPAPDMSRYVFYKKKIDTAQPLTVNAGNIDVIIRTMRAQGHGTRIESFKINIDSNIGKEIDKMIRDFLGLDG